MGVASECGEQEVGVASGSGWNLWVCMATGCGCKEVYTTFCLILTPLFFFAAASLLFCSFF